MDALGVVFLVIILAIIISYYILFLKKINKIEKKQFKYKLIFFLGCIISIVIAIVIYFCFENFILIDFLKLEVNDTYGERITESIIIFSLNIITNFYFLKFYLKRILNQKNEIELIGTE
ncbi:MAG: hypothetical protein ABI576_03790 [Flavobacterium sp.]